MVEIKDKGKMILAIVVIAICIFEMIALGVIGGGGGGGGNTVVESVTGTAEFSGTIRTYDPVLVVNSPLDTDTVAELRAMPGVADVSPSQDGTVIRTETRDDVYPIGVFLREKNLTAYTVANIAPPPFIPVELGNGSIVNATPGNIALRVVTEPLVDVDSEITIKMIAQVSQDVLIGYGSPLIVSEEKKAEAQGTVLSMVYIYTYSIPWAERNGIDAEALRSEYGNAEYRAKNTVLFNQPLTVEEVMAKRNVSYITYIDQYGIECSGNFTDMTQVETDFGQAGASFQPSVLTVITNRTADLNYSGSLVYRYLISLPDEAGGMAIESDSVEIESEKPHEVGSVVPLEITGIAMGDRIVAIKNVVLKE
ncbi:hypothetical protein H0O02_01495 [Candidatus Micrarchaeota archaeon]|nr:hypothetical protein [Candidatus Micrarchaeota archaeon]